MILLYLTYKKIEQEESNAIEFKKDMIDKIFEKMRQTKRMF